MILRTRSARRAVRVVAGVVAALLVSGNVLAAAGLCALKAPPAAKTATEVPCPQHLFDDASTPAPTAQHCPADDPSAQARTADLLGAQLIAAIAVMPFVSAVVQAPPLELRADTGSPQRPLYARLSRLQL